MNKINVVLHGMLGEKFGKKWKLKIATAKEAIHAIDLQKRGLKTFLQSKDKLGYFYRVIINKKDILSVYQLDKELDKDVEEIHFIPILMGAGGDSAGLNWAAIGIGSVLVVAGALLAAFTVGTGAILGVTLISAGLSLIAGGVIGLLSPQPKPDEQKAQKRRQSYLFDSSSANVTNQGAPVPLGYGTFLIPGILIDSYISTEDTDGD